MVRNWHLCHPAGGSGGAELQEAENHSGVPRTGVLRAAREEGCEGAGGKVRRVSGYPDVFSTRGGERPVLPRTWWNPRMRPYLEELSRFLRELPSFSLSMFSTKNM